MNKVPDTTETVRKVPLPSEQPRSLRRVKPKGLLEKETAWRP